MNRSGAGAPAGNKNALKHGRNTDIGRAEALAARALDALAQIVERLEAINRHIDDAAAINPQLAAILADNKRARSSSRAAVSKTKKQSR